MVSCVQFRAFVSQVETAVQTSPPDSGSPSPTAEETITTEKPDAPGSSTGAEYIIASPALKYKVKAAKTGSSGVEPHYHLSRDVIPWQPDDCQKCSCCHEHFHHHNNRCCRERYCRESQPEEETNRRRKSRATVNEKRQQHRSTSEPIASDFDSDYELYKQRHMRRLEKELKNNAAGGEPFSRRHIAEVPERETTKKFKHNVKMSNEFGQDDIEGVTESMEDLKLRKNRQRKEKTASDTKVSSNFSSDKEISCENQDISATKNEKKESILRRSESPVTVEEKIPTGKTEESSEVKTRATRPGLGSAIGQVSENTDPGAMARISLPMCIWRWEFQHFLSNSCVVSCRW